MVVLPCNDVFCYDGRLFFAFQDMTLIFLRGTPSRTVCSAYNGAKRKSLRGANGEAARGGGGTDGRKVSKAA